MNMSGVAQAAQAVAEVDARLTEIFQKHFQVNDKASPGHNAYALQAIEVAISLANLFLSIKNPQEHRHYRAICDTTYHLNTNDFWVKNASVLLPIVHVCLNTYRDGVDLVVERTQRNEYSSNDALISASKAAPLEIFPVIAYLIGGPKLMVEASLPLKLDLAPYFIS